MIKLEITLIKPDAEVYDLYKAITELAKDVPNPDDMEIGVITDPFDGEAMAIWQVKHI